MLHKIKNKFRMFLEQRKSIDNIYTLDGRVPFLRSIPYGFQHVLAMFVANITPVIIVAGVCGLGTDDTARLIQTAMIIAGIGTLIQLFPLWRVGAKMPVVMGISFTFVSALCVIGASDGGYAKSMGAVIVGGIAEGLLGLFAKYWRKIISPIVAACVVTSIGFSLFSVGANSFGGGNGAADFGSWQNWLLALLKAHQRRAQGDVFGDAVRAGIAGDEQIFVKGMGCGGEEICHLSDPPLCYSKKFTAARNMPRSNPPGLFL